MINEIHTLELPKLAKHDYPETELLGNGFSSSMQRQRRNLKWQQKKVTTLRRHTGCCGAASGNGTGKRSDM